MIQFVLMVLVFLSACMTRQVETNAQADRLKDEVVACMQEQPCDASEMFAENWNEQVAQISPTKKAMRTFDRFRPEKAARCIDVYDRYVRWRMESAEHVPLASASLPSRQQSYTVLQIETRRDRCLATYHKVMQTLIRAPDELVFNSARLSRAKLVREYTAVLAKRGIAPEMVHINPENLAREYARGIEEDYQAVMAKVIADKAPLCELLKLGDSAPPHGLTPAQQKSLQCESAAAAAR